jgi:hypothetical protein
MSISTGAWGFFSGIPCTVSQAVTPELRSRLESQLIPEEGTRSEIKNALFAAYELGVEVYRAYMDDIHGQFAACAKNYLFEITKPEAHFLEPMLLEDFRNTHGMSASVFRKIYGSGGINRVLWDRTKGRQYYDDS